MAVSTGIVSTVRCEFPIPVAFAAWAFLDPPPVAIEFQITHSLNWYLNRFKPYLIAFRRIHTPRPAFPFLDDQFAILESPMNLPSFVVAHAHFIHDGRDHILML